ncbi:hypothetical protein ABTG06_19230, partial [Acinetobacter baumannii]
ERKAQRILGEAHLSVLLEACLAVMVLVALRDTRVSPARRAYFRSVLLRLNDSFWSARPPWPIDNPGDNTEYTQANKNNRESSLGTPAL